MSVTAKRKPLLSPARSAAFEVLQAVETGSYASDMLRERTSRLESRDAGLASQIVYGTLRFRLQLDYLILHYSGRSADRLDASVAMALRTAIFQLRYLERIPPHAAVHETVEWMKHHRRAASGLVNAVLRKVNRQPVSWPDRATRLSCPEWLLQRWDQHFGPAQSAAIAQAALLPPEQYVRVPPHQDPPDGLTLAGTDVAGAFRIVDAVHIDGVRAEDLRLHDVSSQAILPLLEVAPGHRYLDVCSAPGNKTRQALEQRPALAVAADFSLPRLRSVGNICPRLLMDGTRPLPFPAASFDRIFIDAPCSGTGTVGRNPEIKWRVKNDDFPEFAARQFLLVENALKVLAPTGKILYATCSLEAEENEAVIAKVCSRNPHVQRGRELWRLPGRDAGDGFYAAILGFEKPCGS